MDIKRLKDLVRVSYTNSYNMTNRQTERLDEIHQQKIDQTLDNLKWYFNLMDEEAKNGFIDLKSKEKINVLELRIKQIKDYFLEYAGVYEFEFLDYMHALEKKVIGIYKSYTEDSKDFRRLLRKLERQRTIKIKDYDPDLEDTFII